MPTDSDDLQPLRNFLASIEDDHEARVLNDEQVEQVAWAFVVSWPTIPALSGLVSRLRAAADRLDSGSFAATQEERSRLRDKRSGVLLALSYVEEELRSAQAHEADALAAIKSWVDVDMDGSIGERQDAREALHAFWQAHSGESDPADPGSLGAADEIDNASGPDDA